MSSIPAVFAAGYFQRRNLDEVAYLSYREVYTVVLVSVLLFMAYLLFRKVLPIKKDIKNRIGVLVDRVVAHKSFFPTVGTYFLFFEDPSLPNKEVSKEEFENISEGDVYSIPMAAHSKIVVDGFMNYDLL